MTELEKIANRGYSPGFLQGTLNENDIHYDKNEPVQTHKFIGVIRDFREHKSLKKKLYEVEIRNRVEKGDSIEIMTPDGAKKSKILGIYDLKKPEEIGIAHGGAGNKFIELKEKLKKGAFLRKICENSDSK